MARYIAKERGQIPADDVQPTKRADSSPSRKVMRIVEKGEEFDFYGKPGKWMQPIDGRRAKPAPEPGKSVGRQVKQTQSGQTDQAGSQALQSAGADIGGPGSQ